MSYSLVGPSPTASLHEWATWLADLYELRPTSEVRAAIRKAEKRFSSTRPTPAASRLRASASRSSTETASFYRGHGATAGGRPPTGAPRWSRASPP